MLSATRKCTLLLAVAGLVLHAPQVLAQESSGDAQTDHRRFFALPLEVDADSGAANGDATILRIMPVYGFPSVGKWDVIHMNLITLADAPTRFPVTGYLESAT